MRSCRGKMSVYSQSCAAAHRLWHLRNRHRQGALIYLAGQLQYVPLVLPVPLVAYLLQNGELVAEYDAFESLPMFAIRSFSACAGGAHRALACPLRWGPPS